jgi:hypothetical protein
VNVVRNPVPGEELVELLIVDAMGSFDLAIQIWGPGPDVDVPDVEGFEMPVEVGLEFGAIVRLNGVDAEGQSPEDVIDEGDGHPLIAGVVDFQHANAGAFVDRRELVEPPAGARNPLKKLDVDLEARAPAAPSHSTSSGAHGGGIFGSLGSGFMPCLRRMRWTEAHAIERL